jgi:glycosyltransferase involved in cell wall biosynthesis
MNILITTDIFPPDIGGPARYVSLMALELWKRGHRVCVLTFRDSGGFDDVTHPFQVIRVSWMFLPFRLLVLGLEILRQGRKADLLFINGRFLEVDVVNVLLRKPLVRKVVGDWAWERARLRGWTGDSFEEFQKKRHGLMITFLKALQRWSTCRADRVIVPCCYLRHWVTQWGVPQEKTVVIPNAVEPVERIIPIEAPLSTATKIVTVGRLTRQKRVDQVIEVVSRLDGVGLVVVGDGPDRPRLEELARTLGSAGRLYFAGKRSQAEILALMAACDIFVLNSTHEGFPHVLLEAMSVGLPVVATAVGGIPEIVKDGHNGCLIPVSSGKALEEALLKLLSTSSTRKLLAAGAKQTSKQFDLGQMAEGTEAVLAAVVDQSS